MALTKVTTGGITDATIATADIANDAVTSAQIADNAVVRAAINAEAVSTSKIEGLAVTTAKIADQAVDLTKLPHGTSSNDGKFLRANNGADPTFETVNTDLVSDTSPQLGGNLDTNSFEISFDDNHSAIFGDGSDLKILHTGSESRIDFTNTNHNLKLMGPGGSHFIDLQPRNGHSSVKAIANGAAELYHDNSKKFETTSSGVEVFGELQMDDGNSHIKLIDGARIDIGSSADLQIFHSGGEIFIRGNASTSALCIVCCNELQIRHLDTNGSNSEKMLVCNDDGSVELYHNNSLTFSTKALGVNVRGNLHAAPAGTSFSTDNDTYVIQAAAPSQAYMSAYAANTGTNLFNHGIHVGIDTSTANIIIRENKNLNFYTNDAHRLTLQSDGNLVPAANNSFNLGGASNRWANIFTSDLNLSNEGSSNDVDGTWGNYTIQEGAEDLFLINKRNGKKFKFNLTEVS